jgi:Zn-dependent protease
MKWSWRIGRIAGIDVYMHATFLILLAWVAFVYYGKGGLASSLAGIAFICVLFGIVVLHELGHALAARRYGIATRDITLLPIGGVARLERMPEDPKQELVVALAGPAVNVVLAAILGIAYWVVENKLPHSRLAEFSDDVLYQFFQVNLWLAGFNLLPAFPMDGGRVLRALLATRMEYTRATQTAASVGQMMALLFGLVGLLVGNVVLMFVALFVYLGAAEEAGMVQMRSALSGVPIQRAMITDFRTLHPDDPLRRGVEHTLAGFQQDFPVVVDGKVVGVLTRGDLMKALAERGLDAPVGEFMHREVDEADPHEMLEGVLSRLQQAHGRSMPVVSRGQLVGMVTAENLSELLMIQQALRQARATEPQDRAKV